MSIAFASMRASRVYSRARSISVRTPSTHSIRTTPSRTRRWSVQQLYRIERAVRGEYATDPGRMVRPSSWKVSKRFNLDYGIRWTWAGDESQQSGAAVCVHAKPVQRQPGSSAVCPADAGRGQICTESPYRACFPLMWGCSFQACGNTCSWGSDPGDNTGSDRVRISRAFFGDRALAFAYDVFG